MFAKEILLRAKGHDAGGVNFIVSHVVMPFDVIEIHGVGNAVILVEIFEIAKEVGVISDTSDIAFEVPVIHRVEADECDEQSPVGFHQA